MPATALTLTALLIAGGIGGLVLIATTPPPNPSRLGITLDDRGVPLLLARECHSVEIRYAQIERRADGAGPVVWTARLTDAPGRADLPLADRVSGYRVTGSLSVVGDEWLEVATVRDGRDVSVGDSLLVFRGSDLHPDQVLVGVTGRDGKLRYESPAEFSESPAGC